MRHALTLTLALLVPLLAGCFSDDPATTGGDAPAARTAEDAGATTGPAPSAPKEAYEVAPDAEAKDKTVTAYPALVATNPAKPPVVVDLSDQFKPGDCRGLRFGDVEEVLATASRPRRFHDITDQLAVGDVFQYEILFRYESKDSAWGDIHPSFGIGSTVREHQDPTVDARGPVEVNWTGQGFRASEEDMAWVHVACWVGVHSEPIPYTLTVTLTFADAAVPAEAPMLVPVPEGATRMFVRGVALDGGRGVSSHFRLFGPDDALVCECALGAMDEIAIVPLTQAGDHVLLVDHTDNGFVSVAFDAPPTAPLVALQSEWIRTPLVSAEAGPVDETIELDLPKVPLFMNARVIGPDTPTPGTGQHTSVTITNGRGQPLRVAWGGHYAMQPFGGDNGFWLGLGPGEWAHDVDHHAFAPGTHVATVKSDLLRGQLFLLTRQYVR